MTVTIPGEPPLDKGLLSADGRLDKVAMKA